MLFCKFLSDIISAENSFFKFLFKNLTRMRFEKLIGNISENMRRDRLWKFIWAAFAKAIFKESSANHFRKFIWKCCWKSLSCMYKRGAMAKPFSKKSVGNTFANAFEKGFINLVCGII